MKKGISKIIQLVIFISLTQFNCASVNNKPLTSDNNPETRNNEYNSPNENTFTEKKKNKIALIVTIGEYGKDTEWPSLNSNNDASLVKYALIRQGFKEGNIAVIQDNKANKTGIIKAIETQLINKAKQGDIAVFHFSGHGQQLKDDNGDEFDGFDETIVPFDSPMRFKAGVYEGDKLIRDEELGDLMTALRKKLGKDGNLMLILDSCHSGTGTRGLRSARGTDVIMASAQYIKSNETRPFDNNRLETSKGIKEKKLAPMVSFFGSAAHELNYEAVSHEGNVVGSLSYAFSQAFAEAERDATYQSIFERIKIKMSSLVPRQTPQAEGQLDQQILGGKILGELTYFQLGEEDWIDGQELSLSAGLLSNLFPSTKVGFYPAGTRDLDEVNPIAIGIVKEAELLNCVIELNQPLSKQELLSSRIFITRQNYGNLEVKLKIDLDKGELKIALMQELSEFSIINVVNDNPDLLVEVMPTTAESSRVQLLTSDEHQLFLSKNKSSSKRIARQLVQSMLSYMQCQFLRTLDMKEDEMDVRLEFLLIKDGKDSKQPTSDLRDGVIRFKLGDKFKLVIQNHGKKGAYYTVLDIQPNNKIGILIPNNNLSERTSTELYIKPGEKQLFDTIFEIVPPLGSDILKLIATSEPLDLSAIQSTRGQTDQENPHPFEKLFAASYLYENRGGVSFNLFPEISIYSKMFVIEE